MEYTTQNLEYAVSVFYNGEQTERARAHAWLTEAQRAPDAWQFVWELLQPNKGTEIQFYAATTLHTKILRSWNDVPVESHEELKNKLLEAVLMYSKGPKIVTNRLCISLAAFILQQGATDLPSMLRPLSTPEHSALLLEVLTVIPEEYNSMTMGTPLRARNRTALQQTCPAVLDDMLRYLSTVYSDYSKETPPEELIQSWHSAATCACSWLSLGGEGSPDTASAPLTDRMPLCRALQTAVHVIYTWNEAVSDTALDACEACLSAVRAAGGAYNAHRHPHAALQLVSELAALAAHMLARDNVPNSINEELLSAVITCIVAIGENHASAIVRAIEGSPSNEGARQLIEVLLAAQAAPGHYPVHETRSNLIFGFWYSLQDELLNIIGNSDKTNPIWQEIFTRLLTTLVTKSETPSNLSLTRDDKELLRCYRQDIADSVMYCFAILGDLCWSTVEAAFLSAQTSVRREAALHILYALADAAPSEPAPPALLAMLQRAVHLTQTEPSEHILATALDCLGGYSMWLSNVPGPRGPELCRACIQAAGGALDRCTTSAARALRRLCTDCPTSAAELAPDIVRVAQGPQARADSWVRRQLLTAAGSALSTIEDAEPLLDEIVQLLVHDCTAQASEPGRASGAAECVVALMSALDKRPERAARVLRAVLPTLPPYAHNVALTEALFSILKQALCSMVEESMIEDLAQLCATSITAQPSASGLDFVKMLTIAVGESWSGTSGLVRTAVVTAARAVAPDPPALADVTEALFILLHSLTKKKPLYVEAIDDVLAELVELACSCVRMWETRAARAACAWLAALAALRPLALQPHAPALTATALKCIGGASPRHQIDPVAELLLSLNRATFAAGDLGAWLRQALDLPGFPTVHATDTHKHKFITAVIKEKSSKRRILETVQEFSLACRGLIGTEYGRQTIAAKQMVA